MKTKLIIVAALASLALVRPAFTQTVAPPATPAAPTPPQPIAEAAPVPVGANQSAPAPAAVPAPPTPSVQLDQARGRYQRAVDVFQSLRSGKQPSAPVIVDFGEIKDAKVRQSLSEDLTIMHRILANAADEVSSPPSPPTAMGIDVFTATGKASPQSLYLGGFGTVFFLDVKFPLLGSPAEKAEKTAEEKTKDNVWEQTKRELYGPPQPPSGGKRQMMDLRMMIRYGLVRLPPGTAPPVEPEAARVEFSAAQVESLKQALLKALANASNIHGLKPEDTVIVVVRGGPVEKGTRTDNAPNGVSVKAIGFVTTYAEPASTLTIRVKAGDAQALAAGKLSLEQFTKQATIAIY